jgi:hypothetical protein
MADVSSARRLSDALINCGACVPQTKINGVESVTETP